MANFNLNDILNDERFLNYSSKTKFAPIEEQQLATTGTNIASPVVEPVTTISNPKLNPKTTTREMYTTIFNQPATNQQSQGIRSKYYDPELGKLVGSVNDPESQKIENYLRLASEGKNLEATRLANQQRSRYSSGLKSSMASQEGRYNPALDMEIQRSLSQSPLAYKAEQTINEQQASQQAQTALNEFVNSQRDLDLEGAKLQENYSNAIRQYNSKLQELYADALLRGVSADQAEADARTKIEGVQQGYALQQYRQQLDDYNKRRADAKKNAMFAGTAVIDTAGNIATKVI